VKPESPSDLVGIGLPQREVGEHVVGRSVGHYAPGRDSELDRGDHTPGRSGPLLVPVDSKPTVRSLTGKQGSKRRSLGDLSLRSAYRTGLLWRIENIGEGKVPYRWVSRLEEPADSGVLAIQHRSRCRYRARLLLTSSTTTPGWDSSERNGRARLARSSNPGGPVPGSRRPWLVSLAPPTAHARSRRWDQVRRPR